MNKIKILEIVPNMQQGGLENLIMNIIRNLDMQKYEIHFLYHYTGNYYFDEEIQKIIWEKVKEVNNILIKEEEADQKKRQEAREELFRRLNKVWDLLWD